MLVLKHEEINQDCMVGNYYIIEREDKYLILEFVGSSSKYVLLSLVNEVFKN